MAVKNMTWSLLGLSTEENVADRAVKGGLQAVWTITWGL
jgi:hypothetical protein